MHQPSAGIGGTASDIAIQAEQFKLTKVADGRAHRRAHRPDRRADPGRLRPRPLVHRPAGARVRLRRPRRQPRGADAQRQPARLRPERADHERAQTSGTQAPSAVALRAAVLRRADELRHQGVEPVQQAVRGAHHLPRRADRRRRRQRRHGAADRAGVHRPRPRHPDLHQLARRLVHRADRDLRHDAVRPARDPDLSAWARPPRPPRCCWPRARRASASPCRTRGS